MKKKQISAFLLTLVLLFSLSVPAFAADVTYENQAVSFAPGSSYSETDLFSDFKDLMPGDTITQSVVIHNESSKQVTIYMRAIPHDPQNNPLSEKVREELETDKRMGRQSPISYMSDFLAQLKMTVWKGVDEVDANKIYEASPDQTAGLTDNVNVAVGRLSANTSTVLTVKLEVPATLGNEYADRIGEVDWVFTVEERSSGGGDPTPTPEEPPLEDIPDEDPPLVDLPDEEIPLVPATGDNTRILPYVCLFGLSLLGLLLFAATEIKRMRAKRNG